MASVALETLLSIISQSGFCGLKLRIFCESGGPLLELQALTAVGKFLFGILHCAAACCVRDGNGILLASCGSGAPKDTVDSPAGARERRRSRSEQASDTPGRK